MQYSAIKPEDHWIDEERFREIEYFQGFYPRSMKEIQTYVSAECDKMDYPNSPMYDEYPDRMLVNQVCLNICRSIPEEAGARLWGGEPISDGYTEVEEVEVYEVLKGQQVDGREMRGSRPPWGPPPPPRPPWGPPGPPPPPRPPWGPPGPPPPPRPPWGPPGPPPPPRPPWGPPGPPPPPRPPWGPPGSNRPNWIHDIVKVLLLNEMQRRRCRSGRCY